jgi:hypothetical protein
MFTNFCSFAGESLHELLDKEIGDTLLKKNTKFQEECFMGHPDRHGEI